MDSLTQIVLGIAVAEWCAGRELKNKTFVYGAILGTMPDLDILTGLVLDPVNAVMMHRGASHSLLLFLLLSPVLGAIISKIENKKISFYKSASMVFWCLFTHVLLDMFTSWGTQTLWPLEKRFAFKTIFVIDPLYTIPLLVTVVLTFRVRDTVLRKNYITKGLIISSAYLALSCVVKLYAVTRFEKALLKQRVIYSEIIVKPTAFNIILWNANIATEDGYLLGDYSLFDSQAISFTKYSKNRELDSVLKGNSDFEKLKKISEGWYIISKNNDILYFNDLRFGLLNNSPKNPQFAFSYQFVPSDSGLKAVEVAKKKREGKLLLQKTFKRLQGN